MRFGNSCRRRRFNHRIGFAMLIRMKSWIVLVLCVGCSKSSSPTGATGSGSDTTKSPPKPQFSMEVCSTSKQVVESEFGAIEAFTRSRMYAAKAEALGKGSGVDAANAFVPVIVAASDAAKNGSAHATEKAPALLANAKDVAAKITAAKDAFNAFFDGASPKTHDTLAQIGNLDATAPDARDKVWASLELETTKLLTEADRLQKSCEGEP